MIPIMALSKVAFLYEFVCIKLFFYRSIFTRHPFPKDTLGPTVALIKTTFSPI
jgi:hypothetical protein